MAPSFVISGTAMSSSITTARNLTMAPGDFAARYGSNVRKTRRSEFLKRKQNLSLRENIKWKIISHWEPPSVACCCNISRRRWSSLSPGSPASSPGWVASSHRHCVSCNEGAPGNLGDKNFTEIERDFHDSQVGNAYFVFRASTVMRVLSEDC